MNYGGLNALIDLVNSADFHVLGVPSNVFGLQVTCPSRIYSLGIHTFGFFVWGHLQNLSLICAIIFQEPGRNSEILNGIREVRPGNGYVPGNNFVLTSKYDVNGDAEHPLFTYMKVSESIYKTKTIGETYNT